MRAIVALGSITPVFIVGYWGAVFAGAFPVPELVPGYRSFFMSFPIADGWIAAWAALAAVAAWKRQDRARAYAMVAGSGLVFLGLCAMTYGISTALICRPTLDEYVEIGIKVYCLGAGGFLTAWGFGTGHAGCAAPGLS